MFKKIYFSLPFLLATSITQAVTINVNTTNGDSNFHNALLNNSNFGLPSSVVPNRTFNIQNVGGSFSNADLNNSDIFIVSSKHTVTNTQASDLFNYVLTGGNLFIYSDYHITDINNVNPVASLFGVHFHDAWTLSGFQVQPGTNIVTSGPFTVGNLGEYWTNAVSYIDSLGSYATSIAHINPLMSNTALINSNVLAPGAGAVLFYSDWADDTFAGYSNNTNKNMILNFFANVASDIATPIPEPSSLLLCSAALFVLTRLKSSPRNRKNFFYA